MSDILMTPRPGRPVSEPTVVGALGTFVFRKPTALEIIRGQKRTIELLDGVRYEDMTPDGLLLINTIVLLELGIEEAPVGWAPGEVDEIDILMEVVQAYNAWRASFRPAVAQQQEAAGQGV